MFNVRGSLLRFFGPVSAPSFVIAVTAIGLLVWQWSSALNEADDARVQAIESTFAANRNLVRAFEEHLVRTLEDVERISGLVDSRLLTGAGSETLWRDHIAEYLKASDGLIRSVSTVDGAGVLTAINTPESHYDPRDFDFYQALKDAKGSGIYVGKAYFRKSSASWEIPVARRIEKSDGSFGGLVVVNIDPAYFSQFYRTIEVGSGGSIAIAGLDGFIRARVIDGAVDSGVDIRGSEMFKAANLNPSGQLLLADQPGAKRRLVVYRDLKKYRLRVAISTLEENVLRGINGRIWDIYFSSALGTTTGGILLAWLLFLVRREKSTLAQLGSERRFMQQIMEAAPAYIIIRDANGRVVSLNRYSQEAFGYSVEDLHGPAGLGVAIPARELVPLLERVRQGISGKPIPPATVTIRTKSGEMRKVEWQSRALRGADDEVTGLLSVGYDVTERMQVERMIKQREQSLRLAQSYANLGSWEYQIRERTLRISEGVAAIHGRDIKRVEFTFDEFLRSVHREDRQRVLTAFHVALDGEGPYDSEYRVLRPDHSICWMRSRGGVQRDSSGVAVRMFGVVEDIDARKRIEAELVKLKEEAEKANNAKSEFVSRMSHELRTPLAAILGFAQLMQLDEKDGRPVQSGSTGMIVKAGWHLLNLINDVLDLSKIEAGILRVALDRVSLHGAIVEVVEILRPVAEANSIDLSVTLEEGSTSSVWADHTRLKQVLMNLVSNAIKYNQRGGFVRLSVAKRCETKAAIIVADSGRGMAPDQMRHLFEPFNRLGAESEEIEGTGIGLVISKHLVEAMNGSLAATSELGRGSEFTVELYAADALCPLDPVPPAPALLFNSDLTGTVLCVDDNPQNLDLMAEIFRRRPGIHMLAAPNGVIGLEIARSVHPSLIVLDVNLPGISGVEVCRVLRSNPSTSGIPVIGVSANALPQAEHLALQAGFSAYLKKPIDVVEFLAMFDRLIERGARTVEES